MRLGGRKSLGLSLEVALLASALGGALAAAAVQTRHVTMKDVDFSPAETRARIGEAVEWTNADPFAHTATAEDVSWEVEVAPGRTGSMVLRQAGRSPYLCRYHPNMRGTIIVDP